MTDPTTAAPPAVEPRLRLRGMRRSFGPVVAVRDVDLDVAPGSIHALLGENGAGKSTLMNITYGMYRRDAGTIAVDGTPVDIGGPADAIAAGLAMVHQHHMLVASLTVAETISLATAEGQPGRRGRTRVRWDRAGSAARVRELAGGLGLDLDPGARIEDLTLAGRQRVEIITAVHRDAQLLILDEPTAVLAPSEVDPFFELLRRMAAAGRSIVLITHRMREVFAVCDAISVMRRGALVYSAPTAETSPEVVLAHLAGVAGEATEAIPDGGDDVAVLAQAGELPGDSAVLARAGELPGDSAVLAQAGELPSDSAVLTEADAMLSGTSGLAEESLVAAPVGPVVLEVTGLSAPSAPGSTGLDACGFSVRAGEILGIAGVEGNGQGELVRILAGMDASPTGGITVADEPLRGRPARDQIAVVPEDRHHDGLVLDLTVEENLVLDHLGDYTRAGLLQTGAMRRDAAAAVAEYAIVTASTSAPLRSMSGGNQQKVVLARALSGRPKVLVTAQATRGLDPGAAGAVLDRIRAARDAGTAVVYIGSDLDEVFAVSDRVAVLFGGRIVGETARGPADRAAVTAWMVGGESPAAPSGTTAAVSGVGEDGSAAPSGTGATATPTGAPAATPTGSPTGTATGTDGKDIA